TVVRGGRLRGLPISEHLDMHGGEDAQRTIPHQVGRAGLARFPQALLDDPAPRRLGLRVEPSELNGREITGGQPAQSARWCAFKDWTICDPLAIKNAQGVGISLGERLRPWLLPDPDLTPTAADVEPLIAVAILVRHEIGEIDPGHASTSSHLDGLS